ncbi:hypothetical protein ACFQV8_14805 [Pseudonocardia benzenivorans]
MPDVVRYGDVSAAHPAALTGALGTGPTAPAALPPHALAELALAAGNSDPARVEAGVLSIDAGGLLPDTAGVNSWTQPVEDVDPLELLEVQLCNQTAPFILISRLRPALAASPARRTYVVNVSAMEGQFHRAYKGPGHPHTNMSKAALNMLTRTSAAEMLERDGILMTAVDTGWITDERPHPRGCGWPPRASTPRSTWSTARPGCTTRSCAARRARTCTAAFSRTTRRRTGERPGPVSAPDR